MNEDAPEDSRDGVAPLPRSPELMRANNTALLVVDMQERLVLAIQQANTVIWNCWRLIDGARILGVRIDATEQYPEKLGRTVPLLAERLYNAPPSKLAFSCGACGEIFDGWRAAGIERVLVCGIETHVCVQQTVLDLLAAGYQTYVACDAVGSRAALDHEIALRRMESSGAVLTTTEAALFELCEVAGTPQFKQISALVKEAPPSA